MILVFDIETIPDITSAKKLYDFNHLTDEEVILALFALRRQKTGNDFLPHHLQKVVAISLVLATEQDIKVWSLGNESSTETELLTRFFSGLEKHTPTLVSWNGSGFDLPVLHYRALLNNIQAPLYWETGDNQATFRWNNYLNRYHYRHLDLMDILSAYQSKAYAPLDDIAVMLGFPGKMGLSGASVWQQYLKGELQAIRNYCETDVLNTYCIYLKFEHMRGQLSTKQLEDKMNQLKSMLALSSQNHLLEFLKGLTNTSS